MYARFSQFCGEAAVAGEGRQMKLRWLIYPAERWGGETEFDPAFWLREAWFWVALRPWHGLREWLRPSPAPPESDDGPGMRGLREDLSALIYGLAPGRREER